MFEKACDRKPISVIMSTLAAEAYVPGQSLTETMAAVLKAFDDFRRSNSDVVLNPVNPQENFADRWKTPVGRRLELKQNFHRWIIQANADFERILAESEPRELVKRVEAGWRTRLSENAVVSSLATPAACSALAAPRRVRIESAPRPWSSKV
jgi:hypothetical protein